MDNIGTVVIIFLACTLSFVAGATIDFAVNRACTKLQRQTMQNLYKIIDIQKNEISLLKTTPPQNPDEE